MIQIIFWVSLLTLAIIYMINVFQGFFLLVPFYPSNKKAIKIMIDRLKQAGVKNVAELGSGDARISFALARAGFNVTGYEVNPFLTLYSKLVAKLTRTKVRIYNKNFFNADLGQYDGLIMYLFPHIMAKIETKVYAEMKDKSVILSNTFSFKQHEPDEKLDEKILVYIVSKSAKTTTGKR